MELTGKVHALPWHAWAEIALHHDWLPDWLVFTHGAVWCLDGGSSALAHCESKEAVHVGTAGQAALRWQETGSMWGHSSTRPKKQIGVIAVLSEEGCEAAPPRRCGAGRPGGRPGRAGACPRAGSAPPRRSAASAPPAPARGAEPRGQACALVPAEGR